MSHELRSWPVRPPPSATASPAARRIAGLSRTSSRTGTTRPPPQAAPPAGADPIAQLKELGELRDKGVLTEEEFAAQKAKVLAS